MKISLLIYNQLQDLTVSNCFRFYSDFMSLLKVQFLFLFVLDMNVILSVHFYGDREPNTINHDERLQFNVVTLGCAFKFFKNDGTILNILCISDGESDVSFSINRNLCLFHNNIRTNKSISYRIYPSSQTNKDSNSEVNTYCTSKFYSILQIHNLSTASCFHGIIFANGYAIYAKMEISDKVLIDTMSFEYTINDNNNNNDTFQKLCNFDLKQTHTHGIELRQDEISGGIVTNTNEFDLIVIKVEMGSNAYSSFGLKFRNNTNIYLTKCLVFAQINNNKFQSKMREYFGNKIDMKCKYQSAPVKLSSRCVVKPTSDHSKEEFQSCANILDYTRLGVIFDNVCDLLNGSNRILSNISKGIVSECLLSNGVLTIKNSFNDILNKWKDENDVSYVDIKLNIIYIKKKKKKKKKKRLLEPDLLLDFCYYGVVMKQMILN